MKRKIFTTVSILTAAIICCTGCMSKEAKSAQKKIDSLPDSYYDGGLPALEDASKSYEELSDEDKDQVKNNAVDSLYEQYYKSIADEINQKTNDFQISGYIDDGKYAECLNDFNEIIESIKSADPNCYENVDFSALRGKIAELKTALQDFSTETSTVSTNVDSLREQLESMKDVYSNYKQIASFCDSVIAVANMVPDKYKSKENFLSKVQDLKQFTSENEFSDDNSDDFVNKYTAVANTYNELVSEIEDVYESFDLDSFESQAEQMSQNVDEINQVIDAHNDAVK